MATSLGPGAGLGQSRPCPYFPAHHNQEGFQSLLPWELEAFKKASETLEDLLSLNDWSCSSHLFPRTKDLKQLPMWEHPVALGARLAAEGP